MSLSWSFSSFSSDTHLKLAHLCTYSTHSLFLTQPTWKTHSLLNTYTHTCSHSQHIMIHSLTQTLTHTLTHTLHRSNAFCRKQVCLYGVSCFYIGSNILVFAHIFEWVRAHFCLCLLPKDGEIALWPSTNGWMRRKWKSNWHRERYSIDGRCRWRRGKRFSSLHENCAPLV